MYTSRFKEEVNLNRPSSPCREHAYDDQKERDNLVKVYLHGKEGELQCQNIYGIPCMIPHVKNLLTLDDQKILHQCTTLHQYKCMFERILNFLRDLHYKFKKSCTSSSISVDYETYDASAVSSITRHHCFFMHASLSSPILCSLQ